MMRMKRTAATVTKFEGWEGANLIKTAVRTAEFFEETFFDLKFCKREFQGALRRERKRTMNKWEINYVFFFF